MSRHGVNAAGAGAGQRTRGDGRASRTRPWRCTGCGSVTRAAVAPKECPWCGPADSGDLPDLGACVLLARLAEVTP